MNLNNRIEHNGVLYEVCYFNSHQHATSGAAGWLERQFPDEKERNEIKGRIIGRNSSFLKKKQDELISFAPIV
jgi:hypothetical protein